MAHETQTKDSLGLTNEEKRKLIKILNHNKIDEIIGYEKEKEHDTEK